MREGMKLKGTVDIILRGPDGRIKRHDIHENLVLDQGFDAINTLLRTGSGAYPLALGIAWTDPDIALNSLTSGDTDFTASAGLMQDWKSAVITKLSDKSWKLVATWGTTEPTPGGSGFPVPIRGIGTYLIASNGNMFSGIVRDPINKESADTLEITYTFVMS